MTNFKWDISANFTKIVNKVVSIFPGITSFGIPGSAFIGSTPSIRVGQPYGVIVGGVIPRDSANRRPPDQPRHRCICHHHRQPGLVQPQPGLYPGRDQYLQVQEPVFWALPSILPRADRSFPLPRPPIKPRRLDRDGKKTATEGWILPGEILSGGKYTKNNIQIPAQTYWGVQGGLQSEFNVYDANGLPYAGTFAQL